MDLDKSPVI